MEDHGAAGRDVGGHGVADHGVADHEAEVAHNKGSSSHREVQEGRSIQNTYPYLFTETIIFNHITWASCTFETVR